MILNSVGMINFINNYATLFSYASLLIPMLGIALYAYGKNRFFSNSNKVAKPSGNEKLEDPSYLVGFENIEEDMYVDQTSGLYTAVIEAEGVAYPTFSEDEKNNLNGMYINFLRSVNFPFSKSIMSRKIDIEPTENQYIQAYERIVSELEGNQTQLDTDPESKILLSKRKLLLEDLSYMGAQLNYIESVIGQIEGSTKRVYYSVSGELDQEALKGLKSDNESLLAYKQNVSDRVVAMRGSLGGCLVQTKQLNNKDLLELARLHYKPYTSMVYKTRIAEEGTKFVFNKELYLNQRVHEQLKEA